MNALPVLEDLSVEMFAEAALPTAHPLPYSRLDVVLLFPPGFAAVEVVVTAPGYQLIAPQCAVELDVAACPPDALATRLVEGVERSSLVFAGVVAAVAGPWSVRTTTGLALLPSPPSRALVATVTPYDRLALPAAEKRLVEVSFEPSTTLSGDILLDVLGPLPMQRGPSCDQVPVSCEGALDVRWCERGPVATSLTLRPHFVRPLRPGERACVVVAVESARGEGVLRGGRWTVTFRSGAATVPTRAGTSESQRPPSIPNPTPL